MITTFTLSTRKLSGGTRHFRLNEFAALFDFNQVAPLALALAFLPCLEKILEAVKGPHATIVLFGTQTCKGADHVEETEW